MSLMIGIVSYLPDTSVRSKRVKAVTKQVEWLHSIYPNECIHIVAQNYTDDDYLVDPYVEYIKYSEGIGASNARNIILEMFYESGADWLLMCDDDSICYPYYSYEAFMRHIVEDPEYFKGVDAVIPIEPEYYPFKKQVAEDSQNLTHYKFSPRYNNSGAAIIFYRNIVKKGHEPLYFDENMVASKGTGREDIDFNLRWIKSGFTCYEMQTWIKKSLAFSDSTIFEGTQQARNKLLDDNLQLTVTKHGIPYKNGHINWKAFNDKYDKSAPVLYIERKEPITLTEKEQPKVKPKRGRSLF